MIFILVFNDCTIFWVLSGKSSSCLIIVTVQFKIPGLNIGLSIGITNIGFNSVIPEYCTSLKKQLIKVLVKVLFIKVKSWLVV